MGSMNLQWCWFFVFASCLGACSPSSAQSPNSALSVGNVIAVNPVTDRIYTGNETLPYVTVIDGATNESTKIAVGGTPAQIVVNAATNRIYVGLLESIGPKSGVTVIDGATNQTTRVAVGASTYGLAVNTATNEVYVANYYGGKITVIDGATNRTHAIQAGLNPADLAINPLTNRIYVANWNSAELTVIDGSTNTKMSVPIRGKSEQHSIAVNTLTNKIYVGSDVESKTVTLIDGLTNQTTAIATAGYVSGLAINPASNKVYVVNPYNGRLSVIDGATNQVTTIAVGQNPTSIAVDPANNKIYVAHSGLCEGVTVLDGATGDMSRIKGGTYLQSVAVNPITHKVYAYDPEAVIVFDPATNKSTDVVLPLPFSLPRYVAHCASNQR